MTARTTRGSGRSVDGRPDLRAAGGDVVSARGRRTGLAAALRAAVGFRVDCPEGRVGILTAVLPEYDDLPPDRIEIASGLFIVTAVNVAFADVVGVEPGRRRVSIAVVPERRRASRLEIARRVHRFLQAGGRPAARPG
jgi:hypothetical protein